MKNLDRRPEFTFQTHEGYSGSPLQEVTGDLLRYVGKSLVLRDISVDSKGEVLSTGGRPMIKGYGKMTPNILQGSGRIYSFTVQELDGTIPDFALGLSMAFGRMEILHNPPSKEKKINGGLLGLLGF